MKRKSACVYFFVFAFFSHPTVLYLQSEQAMMMVKRYFLRIFRFEKNMQNVLCLARTKLVLLCNNLRQKINSIANFCLLFNLEFLYSNWKLTMMRLYLILELSFFLFTPLQLLLRFLRTGRSTQLPASRFLHKLAPLCVAIVYFFANRLWRCVVVGYFSPLVADMSDGEMEDYRRRRENCFCFQF